jgi:hypothetical protein
VHEECESSANGGFLAVGELVCSHVVAGPRCRVLVLDVDQLGNLVFKERDRPVHRFQSGLLTRISANAFSRSVNIRPPCGSNLGYELRGRRDAVRRVGRPLFVLRSSDGGDPPLPRPRLERVCQRERRERRARRLPLVESGRHRSYLSGSGFGQSEPSSAIMRTA